jgi:hypothetical protein
MSCPVKIKALEALKEQGAIGEKRVLNNINTFTRLNRVMTNNARSRWGVGAPGVSLFELKDFQSLRMDGTYANVVRVEPNEMLFDILQEQIDNNAPIDALDSKYNSLFLRTKPTIEFKGVSAEELIEMKDPIGAELLQSELKEEIEKFNNFINCLW